MNYQAYLKLMRPKHYLKNVLIFVPLVFSGLLFTDDYLLRSIFSFLAFSMVASAVYIFNDIVDKDYDKKHPTKKNRPIAAGKVSVRSAAILLVVLLGVATIFQSVAGFTAAGVGLLGYSLGLKHLPIIDVAILSFGFVIRVLYGGYSVDIDISMWLYLAILALSFYLGLGKRRNEIRQNGHETRKVNKFYNQEFLDKNMYVCLGLAIVYYSLWAIDPSQKHDYIYLTIPVVIMITMAYSLAVESSKSEGDPVNVILGNKTLILLSLVYGGLIIGLVYA
jgi:decaprenyl-phosphate phosphoribosyltransferase